MDDALFDRARKLFEARFLRSPRFAASAPGRVNLIGEHTDYSEGFALPMAINRETVIVADRADRENARIHGTDVHETIELELVASAPSRDVNWGSYLEGVLTGALEAGLDPGPFDALIVSNVPIGGGLSSSAALEVSFLTLLERLARKNLEGLDKALLCQRAEQRFAHTPCGLMDQYIAVMAKANTAQLLDCRSNTAMTLFLDPTLAFVVAESGMRHQLATSEYGDRRRQCETAAAAAGHGALRDVTHDDLERASSALTPDVLSRARHVISENQRTLDFFDAMNVGDRTSAGRLMDESHASLRDDFEVSTQELDLLVKIAREVGPEGGVHGSRMTGAGFGGCTITLVDVGRATSVAEHLGATYARKTGLEGRTFVAIATGGATVLTL